MTRRGTFITLEGPEGSGKSSQSRWLVAGLRRQGFRVEALQDPGSTALGRALRRALLQSRAAFSPLMEALLFIGGRAALVEERIRPALQRGSLVVCDRFHDSTLAYQGFGGGLDVAWLDALGRRAIGSTMPEYTVLLDVPTAAGFARLRRAKDRMERKTLRFHRKVRAGYLALARAQPHRFIVVDATRPPAEVHRRITRAVQQRLNVSDTL